MLVCNSETRTDGAQTSVARQFKLTSDDFKPGGTLVCGVVILDIAMLEI